MDEKKDQVNKKDQEVKKPVKNAVDLQKLKLDKLFKNIERPVHLPEPLKKRGFSSAPEFVRNVMGSSAGAGSGEFHVYRHIRRRENARLKYIAEEAVKDDKDEAYQKKLEENWIQSEQRTAKKRAKRQKKKKGRQQEKRPKMAALTAAPAGDDSSESDGDDSESEQGAVEGEMVTQPEQGTAKRVRVPEPESAEGDRVPEPGTAEGDRVPAVAAGQDDESDVTSAAAESDPADRQGARGDTDVVTATDRVGGGPSAGPETDGRSDAADVSTDSPEAGPDKLNSGDHSAAEAK